MTLQKSLTLPIFIIFIIFIIIFIIFIIFIMKESYRYQWDNSPVWIRILRGGLRTLKCGIVDKSTYLVAGNWHPWPIIFSFWISQIGTVVSTSLRSLLFMTLQKMRTLDLEINACCIHIVPFSKRFLLLTDLIHLTTTCLELITWKLKRWIRNRSYW